MTKLLMNKEYKNPFSIRKDHLTCPLPLTLESYWACDADCLHCMSRQLNKIWGEEQRTTDPENVKRVLQNAIKTRKPKTILAQALKKKKPIWLGRKTDPYQSIEMECHVTRELMKHLIDLSWNFILHTRHTGNAIQDMDVFVKGKNLLTLLVEITPGGESDWELFEQKRTTSIDDRFIHIQKWKKEDIQVGVRGEPFIPGHHTISQFKDMLLRLSSHGIDSYNTHNLHMNPLVMKRLYNAGVDIEKVWEYNQDEKWKPILKKLCQIADEIGIKLGCPDFVNTGWEKKEPYNTCCGVCIKNAFKFNTHNWKHLFQKGFTEKDVLNKTWEDIGTESDYNTAVTILQGENKDHYTMKDIK